MHSTIISKKITLLMQCTNVLTWELNRYRRRTTDDGPQTTDDRQHTLNLSFYRMISGPYSSSSNLHWYTRLEVKPRVSLMRFVRSVNPFMFWPHSIPLAFFNVSTMANSSILVTLYLRCVSESFQLKNAIGLLS
jgi:hypothetical protein